MNINKELSRKGIPLSIVIVTYKSNEFIKDCLLSILNGSTLPKQIIVIDNNSPNSPVDIINKLNFKDVKINYHQNRKNLGFAKAANQGAELASESFLLFLNPDLYIKEHALGKIWKHLSKTNKIVGGKIIEMGSSKTKKTVANIPSIKTILVEFTSLKKLLDKRNNNYSSFWDNSVICAQKPIKVESLSGCLFAVKKNDFIKIGKFDEKFFLYLEDLDFFSRAKLLNYPVIFIPEVLGRHFEGGSSKHSIYRINISAWNDSKKHYVKKHFGIVGILMCAVFSLDNFLIDLYKATKQ